MKDGRRPKKGPLSSLMIVPDPFTLYYIVGNQGNRPVRTKGQ